MISSRNPLKRNPCGEKPEDGQLYLFISMQDLICILLHLHSYSSFLFLLSMCTHLQSGAYQPNSLTVTVGGLCLTPVLWPRDNAVTYDLKQNLNCELCLAGSLFCHQQRHDGLPYLDPVNPSSVVFSFSNEQFFLSVAWLASLITDRGGSPVLFSPRAALQEKDRSCHVPAFPLPCEILF